MALPTPSPTLYVSGLESKTKKPGESASPPFIQIELMCDFRAASTAILPLQPLRTSVCCPRLVHELSLIGLSIDIVSKKHDGGRGQAFVVFAGQAAATTAMRNLSGESFYNHSLVCHSPSPSFLILSDR